MEHQVNTYNLFLDDVRSPHDAFTYTTDNAYLTKKWVIVRDYNSFCSTIKAEWESNKTIPELISFDHDLAEEHYLIGAASGFREFDYSKTKEKTGMDCAIWLVEFCLKNKLSCPDYKCHSMNTAGRENIITLLTKFRNLYG